jgi:hypothetical protein
LWDRLRTPKAAGQDPDPTQNSVPDKGQQTKHKLKLEDEVKSKVKQE